MGRDLAGAWAFEDRDERSGESSSRVECLKGLRIGRPAGSQPEDRSYADAFSNADRREHNETGDNSESLP